MKLTHLLSAAAITVATVAGSLTAIDADFQSMNPTAAKIAATKLKSEVARLNGIIGGHAGAAAHHVGLAGTDTDELLKSVGTANCDAYIAAKKAGVKADLGAWVDAIIPGGDGTDFLDAGAVLGVGHGAVAGNPADVTRGAFKVALNALVDTFDHAALNAANAIRVPANARLASLSNAQEDINMGFAALIDAWVDGIIPGGDGTDFLDAGAVLGVGHGAVAGNPADVTRGEFKAALLAVITR